jgi:hypothetical protein
MNITIKKTVFFGLIFLFANAAFGQTQSEKTA